MNSLLINYKYIQNNVCHQRGQLVKAIVDI